MGKSLSKQVMSLGDQHAREFGEKALPHAPRVTIFGLAYAVPQQYLKVKRNLRQLENIVSKIKAPSGYLIFAEERNGQQFIQVGILGTENYSVGTSKDREAKIVYGRRWLIEPSAPTSEVIQTVLLALQKAREHELREHIKIRALDGQHITTPFNTHQDLPLMKQIKHVFNSSETFTTAQQLDHVKLCDLSLELYEEHAFGGDQRVALVRIGAGESVDKLFPEFSARSLCVCWNAQHSQGFLHGLVESLINLSNQYIVENFEFDGFKRFSHTLDVFKIAQFSYETRQLNNATAEFSDVFLAMSYSVDSSKTPLYNSGALGQIQRNRIKAERIELGFLPRTSR